MLITFFTNCQNSFTIFEQTETVVQRCSIKKVFLKILPNSQENTCVRVYFSFIKKETLTEVLSRELYQVLKNNFFKEHLLWLLLNRLLFNRFI